MFFGLWLIGGFAIGFYVRGATEDESEKSYNCQMAFWLCGLACFFMWLLWFSMFAA